MDKVAISAFVEGWFEAIDEYCGITVATSTLVEWWFEAFNLDSFFTKWLNGWIWVYCGVIKGPQETKVAVVVL
jgi:hypothetical protein